MPRRLLATLLSRPGRAVAATTLIEALWDGTPPPTARKTAQVYVRRLRQALGEDGRIVHGAGGYTAVISPDELDALRFGALTRDGRAARDRGDLETAGTHFGQALGLWRGAAYSGVEQAGPILEEVRRLEEQRLLAYEELTAVDLARGRHADLVAGLAEMTEAHPFRDRLRAFLMFALCRLGRQVEALEVYRRTRATLIEELGVEPGRYAPAWFDTERAGLLAGVSQACAAGLDELGWELSAVSVNYFAGRGHYADGADTHRLALRARAGAGNRLGVAVMVRNLARLRTTGVTASAPPRRNRAAGTTAHTDVPDPATGRRRGGAGRIRGRTAR